MDENAKKIQREIAKDKIQIILASIALSVLVVMELYIMINYKSNFMAMAVGVLMMIFALFFLISALMDMSLKQKDIEQEKYEEIYNAQKASYLVIKKSFDEMEQRLRVIEENSSLPAEDIINAQKAVAKVTISRSKENTDALMNSNDELINQLFSIQEKLESNNSQILEKQQTLLKETNLDIQQKIAALTSQISNIEGKIQNGIPVMAAQPMQMQVPPVVPQQPIEPTIESAVEVPIDSMPGTEQIEEPVPNEDIGLDLDINLEEPVSEELPTEDLGLDLDISLEEPAAEEIPVEASDIGLDLDTASEETIEESEVDLSNIDEVTLEEQITEESVEQVLEEIPAEEAPLEEPVVEENIVEEIVAETPAEEQEIEETPVAEIPSEPMPDEAVTEETVLEQAVEESVEEEVVTEEVTAEEINVDEITTEEAVSDDPGASLDALLDEIGEQVEEPEPEPEPVEEPAEEEKDDSIVIPDVGVDLTDPNRVMSPEEIEKLFASI